MTLSQNIRHRRAAAAAGIHRREPQIGFSPTAVFNRPTLPFPIPTFGGRPGEDDDDDADDVVTVTVIVPPSSSAPPVLSLPTSAPSSSPTTSSTPTPPTTSSTPPPTSSSTPVIPSTTNTPSTTAIPSVTPTLTPSKTLTPLSLSSKPLSATGVAASANASANNNDSGSVSTGAIVGGIAAGIVGIAAVGFAVMFFIRRAKKKNEGGFNDNEFRRSAMVLDDPPMTENHYNPRPPSMIERHMAAPAAPASPAPTFGTMYGRPGPAYGQHGSGDEYSQNYAGYGANYQSFSPGQVVNPYANAYPSPTAQPGRPMYPGSPYTQSPFSPMSPTEQYGFQDNVPAASGGAVNSAGYPVLTRKGSNQSSHEGAHGQSTSGATEMRRESVPANDYVDLNRSSVSPYQAAQYVEISRRLNTEPPAGLRTADIDRDLPPVPSKDNSPFADPASAPPSPGAQYAVDRRHLDNGAGRAHERTMSGDSSLVEPQTLDFPAPPSPVHPTSTSRYRIDSMPPSLPEINIEASRVSVSSYPMLASPSVRDSNAPSMLTPGLTPGGAGSRFPTTPSPLASSFGMPSPPPAAATASFVPPGPPPALTPAETAAAAPAAATPAPAPVAAAPAPTARQPSEHALDSKKRNTSYSMYDAEDAYGGI